MTHFPESRSDLEPMMKHAMKLYRYRMDAVARQHGLFFGQAPILHAIAKNEGCTQADIAGRLGVSAPSIAASAKRLEKSGLIRKETDPDNLRRNKLYLTEDGRKALSAAKADMEQVNAEIFSRLDEADRAALPRILSVLIDVLTDGETMVDLR